MGTTRRWWLASLAIAVAACTGGAGGALTIEEAVARFKAEVGTGDLSPGNRDYYEDLYGDSSDADEARLLSPETLGPLFLFSRDGGYEQQDAAGLLEHFDDTWASPEVVVTRGIAVVLMAPPAGAADIVRDVLED